MIAVCALLLLSIFIFLITKYKRTTGAPLPPGPRPWPIIGCLPEMWRNKPADRWANDIFNQFDTDIVCVRLGNIHVIAVQSPEIAKEFLKTHDRIFASRPVTMATHMLSRGYMGSAFTPMGDQWKKMRRVLNEVFNHSKLNWLVDKRNEEADNLVKFIYSQCSKSENGSVVNVRNAAQHYTASVIRRMIFNQRYFGKGSEDGGPGVEEERHVNALLTILLHVYAFCVSDFLPWLRVFDIGGHEKKMREASKIIWQYQDSIIDNRVKKWRSSDHDGKDIEEDLLDVFISLKDAKGQPLLSAEEIKAQIIEVQLAIMDHPFSVAEWVLSEMLNQPEMLRKAEEELNNIVGKDILVQEHHIPRLSYITACARESLRLHPVASFNLPHFSTEDAIVAGYFIPKGSSVLLSRLGLGRNPRIWKNPMTFDPERHLTGAMNQQVVLDERELKFVSFSTGRRGCMGGNLGTTVTIMLLARLLQGFTWSVPPNVDKIDLTEAHQSLFKLKHLHAHAKPRLPASVYPI